jgi:hypothetical protein
MRTYLRVATVLVAVVVVVGGLVAWLDPGLLLPAGTEVTRGVRLYGYRMATRNLALGVGLLVVVLLRWRPGVAALLAVVALVEVGDTVSAIAGADWASGVPAVVIAAIATLTAVTVPHGGLPIFKFRKKAVGGT